MFYDALIDLKVNKVKAKAMYFAVYWKGPRWDMLVSGERCLGAVPTQFPCIKATFTEMRSVEARYDDGDFKKKLLETHNIIEENPEITLEALEKRADGLGINPLLLSAHMTSKRID